MQPLTFLFGIQYSTTFIWSIFWYNAYFWVSSFKVSLAFCFSKLFMLIIRNNDANTINVTSFQWCKKRTWSRNKPNCLSRYLIFSLYISAHPQAPLLGAIKICVYRVSCRWFNLIQFCLKHFSIHWYFWQCLALKWTVWWSYSGPFVQTGSTLGHRTQKSFFFLYKVNWSKKDQLVFFGERKRLTLRLSPTYLDLHTYYTKNVCAWVPYFFFCFSILSQNSSVVQGLRNWDENMEKYEAPSTSCLTFIVFSRFCQF